MPELIQRRMYDTDLDLEGEDSNDDLVGSEGIWRIVEYKASEVEEEVIRVEDEASRVEGLLEESVVREQSLPQALKNQL